MNAPLIRQATLQDYPQLMQLINLTFFADGTSNFCEFLPNVYCDPQIATRHAYLAFDGPTLIGHLGVYPLRLKIAPGRELSAGGIGAVATHPQYRGRGSMTLLLNAAIAGMQDAGYDVSVLGGDRLRYARFGWEVAGRKLEWFVDDRIVRAGREQGTSPLSMVAFDPARHLNAVLDAWNSDVCGTVHTPASFAGIMRRKQWTTQLLSDWSGPGPVPFVTYQRAGGRLSIEKLIGPPDLLLSMLRHLCCTLEPKVEQIVVHCPALDHPVARLAIQAGSSFSQSCACQLRIMNVQRTADKLGVSPDSLAGLDPCAISRQFFGSPADSHQAFPLWIEEPSYV